MKTLITFEVDYSQLFDTLHKMGGDFAPLGERIVGVLLTPEDLSTALGMAVYGVTVKSREQIEEPTS